MSVTHKEDISKPLSVATAEKFLLLDTSQRSGIVAVAEGEKVLGERRLQEARRHARDLAPAVRDLLTGQKWRPNEVTAFVVGTGPGSYTGLRVGIMSAKTFAYATGCALVGISTFAVLAEQAPLEAGTIEVIADAQQGRIYQQRFTRSGAIVAESGPLQIVALTDWLPTLTADICVTGPGVEVIEFQLPAGLCRAEPMRRQVQAASLLQVGRRRWLSGGRDDPFQLAPLYLRPSAAEQQWHGTSQAKSASKEESKRV